MNMGKIVLSALFIAMFVLCMTDTSDAAGKARIPKTGETATIYGAGSDGVLKKGAAWPSPRFADNANGTVTDNLTGLIWLKNANCFVTGQTWVVALASANGLASPSCGLSDGSVAGDWRLPSVTELNSLIDLSAFGPALPAGNPFTTVQNYYWSSSSCAYSTSNAWYVSMFNGVVYFSLKSINYYVWPVRGGQ